MPDLILAFMAESQVAAASRIKTSVKLPLEMVQAVLYELVDRGRLYLWQPGKTPYSCLSEPRKTALESILNALAPGPLGEKELIGRVRKRLPAYQAKDLKEFLSSSKQVYEHPKYGKIKTKYGLEPPEPGPYLGKALQEIHAVRRLLAPCHVSPEAVHEALGRELGLKHDAIGTSGSGSRMRQFPMTPKRSS